MSGERVVADTSALIHLLDGNDEATHVLQGCEVFVSFIRENLPLVTSVDHFARLKDEGALYWIRGVAGNR